MDYQSYQNNISKEEHIIAKPEKWDLRFLELAKFISAWSKDPSTKVGAVIVDAKRRIVGVGYNGFAPKVHDTEERYHNRELKYKLICHAERNAILSANKSCENCTLYTWPFQPCATCTGMIIFSGIKRCVAPKASQEHNERWQYEFEISKTMMKEAEIKLDIIAK